MVNGKNVDGLAVICNAVASSTLIYISDERRREITGYTYLRAVPAGNAHVSTNVRESRDRALSLPAVLGDQSVGIVVTGIVADCAG
jgi:hypothetical protein